MEDKTTETTENGKKPLWRQPDAMLWTATSSVITYAVWCTLLSIITVTGHLVNSPSFECGERPELEATVLSRASLVYSLSGFSLPICILLLVAIWIKESGWYITLSMFGTCLLFVYMAVNFASAWQEENEGLVALEERYMSLRPLSHTSRDPQMPLNVKNCNALDNVYRWQTEFKCCGLQTYTDWWPIVPDSCLCEGVADSSECAQYRNSSVYLKPCLPTVLYLTVKGSHTFWAIMITWLGIVSAPISLLALCLMCGFSMFTYWFCCEPCWYKRSQWKHRLSGGEKMVPVVFLRKDNCDQTDEDSGKDGEVQRSESDEVVAIGTEDGTNAERKGRDLEEEHLIDDNPMRMIPVSLLKRLHKELDPPPVQHQVRCLSLLGRTTWHFYTVMIEKDSPLLPTDAVLADAKEPSKNCALVDGPHVLGVADIIWPTENQP